MIKKKSFDITKYVKGKTAVFIDAANIIYSQQSLKWMVDFKKLGKYFTSSLEVVILNYYHASSKNSKGQQNFFLMLADNGYTLRTKPVKYIKTDEGEVRKGNLDIEIVFDILTNLDGFDTCIMLSGDSDFEIVVKHLRKIGKQVIVMSTKKHVSIEMIRASNKYIDIKKLRQFWERVKKQKNTPEYKSKRG